MDTSPLFQAVDGFAVLSAEGMAVQQALDRWILDRAGEVGAEQMRFPYLLPLQDLARFDYFHNFPHLGLCACTVSERRWTAYSDNDPAATADRIPAADLDDAAFALPPAACYNVYLHARGQDLGQERVVTTVAQCFRNETHYKGLERLRGFTMREIVRIGLPAGITAHLGHFRQRIMGLGQALGLDLKIEVATDPFFDRSSDRALAAGLFPTKEEFVFDGTLAIASLNYHRNFFGERCGITLNGTVASTGCVAFGLERWLHALDRRFEGDARRIIQAIGDAS